MAASEEVAADIRALEERYASVPKVIVGSILAAAR
jgi:hypothetical protein